MAHFLRDGRAVRHAVLPGPRAAVCVRVEKRRPLVLRLDLDPEEPILVLRYDAQVAYLPPGTTVLDPDGEVVEPTGQFAVTLETIDPYHALTDLFPSG